MVGLASRFYVSNSSKEMTSIRSHKAFRPGLNGIITESNHLYPTFIEHFDMQGNGGKVISIAKGNWQSSFHLYAGRSLVENLGYDHLIESEIDS